MRDNLKPAREAAAAKNAERLEDVRWMLETGESMTGAATRLGINVGALEKWLERRGMFAEVSILRGRDPIDPTVSLSDRGRVGAVARWAS